MFTCYQIKTYTYSCFNYLYSWLLLITITITITITAYKSGSCQNVVYISLSTRAAFIKDVKSPITTMTEMGNPFWDNSGDLLVLDTRVMAEVTVADSVSKMKKLGEDQHKEVFKKRLVDSTNTVNETIPKNKLRLFSRHLEKRKSHAQQQLLSWKQAATCFQHCTSPATLVSMMFSTLYIACQVRDAGLGDVFNIVHRLPSTRRWSR